MEEDVIVDLIRMMKLRNKTALPEKKNSRKLGGDSKWVLTVQKSWALPLHYPLGTCVIKKKVVIMSIPCSCMSEVLASTDIFLTIRSKREKFYNTLLSCRIAITIKR